MFLLAGSSAPKKQLLCFEHGQGQKSEQNPTTKNFVVFHNHSPQLTMSKLITEMLTLHLTFAYQGSA